MLGNKVILLFFVGLVFLFSCDDSFQLMKNVKVGNPNLAITGFSPPEGILREDTLTIYGQAFNPLTYQNQVFFPLVSSEELWVNENGEITDSVVYRVTTYSHNPALVVDSTPDSIKVIVPTNAVFGQVRVAFGVDTVTSPINYNLLTTELRPKILSFVPQFGGPGVSLNITVANGFLEAERMVVAFGSFKAQPSEIVGGGIINIFVNVPNIFAGPADLRVGKKLEGGDTLWSTPVNFGILPVPKKVPQLTVVSYLGDVAGSSLTGFVGYAEIVEGIRNQVELTVTDPALETSRGITYNPGNNEVYWLDISGTGALVLGDRETETGDTKKITFSQVYNDLVFAPSGGKNFFYIAGNQIRKLEVNDLFKIPNTAGSSKKIYPTGTPSSATTNITCLKVVGNNFYWVDEIEKKVFKGVLAGTGDFFSTVSVLYDFSTSSLVPYALAVNESTGDLFITEFEGATGNSRSKLVKGSISGGEIAQLILIHEYDNTGDYFYDVEIDATQNYVYWANGRSDDGGIFRKSLLSIQAKPELIYQFPTARYFDIKTE